MSDSVAGGVRNHSLRPSCLSRKAEFWGDQDGGFGLRRRRCPPTDRQLSISSHTEDAAHLFLKPAFVGSIPKPNDYHLIFPKFFTRINESRPLRQSCVTPFPFLGYRRAMLTYSRLSTANILFVNSDIHLTFNRAMALSTRNKIRLRPQDPKNSPSKSA